MRNDLNRRMLVGAGLLSAIVAGSFSTSAFARPNRDDVREERRDVKEARKEMKKARKDVRRADTPSERREEREESREAREDLREQRQELNREKRQNGYGTRYNNRSDNRYNNGRYNNGSYNRGNGYYNRNDRYNNGRFNDYNTTRTLEGVVTSDTRGDSFVIRTNNGRTLRVQAVNGESRRLDRGDIVRVNGNFTGSIFRAYNIDIVRDR